MKESKFNEIEQALNIETSLVESNVSESKIIEVPDDPRNALYKLTKYSGTSMASPQVCGILACLMEQCPRLTQSDAISYLEQHCKLDQMTVTTGGYTDTTSLQGGVNRYLYYNKERKEDGVITPRVTFKARRSSGQVWPRRSTYIY